MVAQPVQRGNAKVALQAFRRAHFSSVAPVNSCFLDGHSRRRRLDHASRFKCFPQGRVEKRCADTGIENFVAEWRSERPRLDGRKSRHQRCPAAGDRSDRDKRDLRSQFWQLSHHGGFGLLYQFQMKYPCCALCNLEKTLDQKSFVP